MQKVRLQKNLRSLKHWVIPIFIGRGRKLLNFVVEDSRRRRESLDMKKEEEGVEKALLEMHFPFLKKRFQRHQKPFIGIALFSMAFTAFATMFMSMGMLSEGQLNI